MRYRVTGNLAWRDGRTVNISDSGVLFRAEDPLVVDTRIEIRLVLPSPATEGSQPEISCQGRIVRTLPPTEPDMRPGLAAAIEEYKFLRPPTPA